MSEKRCQSDIINDIRCIGSLRVGDAREALAECFNEALGGAPSSGAWHKVIWYSETSGGKVVTFKAGSPYEKKVKGRSERSEPIPEEEKEKKRLAESLSRTRKRIFEIAACNPWEWFFTGTLNGEKWDRNDINGVFRALSQWFRDYRKKAGCGDLKYLIVPEQHKKGGWHFHGLFHGLPETELLNFSAGEKIPLRLKRVIQGGTDIFNWSPYSEKFGYTTLTKIKDRHAVACYVTKYITKDMVAENAALGTGRHLYYASQGLKKPAVVAEGYSDASHIFSGYDYENEYVQIRKIDTFEDAVQFVERYRLSRGGEGLETCGNSDS